MRPARSRSLALLAALAWLMPGCVEPELGVVPVLCHFGEPRCPEGYECTQHLILGEVCLKVGEQLPDLVTGPADAGVEAATPDLDGGAGAEAGPDGPRPDVGPDGPVPDAGPDGPLPDVGPDGPLPDGPKPDGPMPDAQSDSQLSDAATDGPGVEAGPDAASPDMSAPDQGGQLDQAQSPDQGSASDQSAAAPDQGKPTLDQAAPDTQ